MKILIALLLSVSLFAQSKEKQAIDASTLKHPVKPALWKIEGKGLEKPSYLFGSIHLGDPRVTTLHPDAEKAFVASDHFYAEIDLDPAKQMAIAPKLMRKDGKTLSESIGPDLTGKLKTAVEEHGLGEKLLHFDNYDLLCQFVGPQSVGITNSLVDIV